MNQFLADGDVGIEVDLTAGFFSSDQVFDSALARAGLFPSTDTCEITSDDSDISLVPEINGIDVEFTSLSAGDVLTLTSPAGTYASLMQTTTFGFTGYTNESDLIGEPPSGLVVNIPGDQFPAFNNVILPSVAVPTGLSPATDSPVAGNTTYTWTAGTDPDARILIYVDNIDCIVLDDGSFTIPANLISQASPDFTFGYELERIKMAFVQSGNALLALIATAES